MYLIIIWIDFNQLVIFAEGTTTDGKGLLDFKRGPFDIQNPVKLYNIKYKNDFIDQNLNFISLTDNIFLTLCQYRTSLKYTELKGCYYPKNFTTWQEFSKETKLLMCNEFNLENYSGTYSERVVYEKMYCPKGYQV